MRALTQQEDEARWKLIRLWSSANHAQVKGCCLQVLLLLSGREVVRTHRHWRLMMKRPFWSAQESLRHLESELPVQHPNETIRLHSMSLCAQNRLPESTSSLRSSSCTISDLPAAGDLVVSDDQAQQCRSVCTSHTRECEPC